MTDEAVITVRVTPRSGRDAVEGADAEGALRIRVTAPPVDGAANAAVARLLAKELHVPRRAVTLVAGAGARRKRLRVEGVTAGEVTARWPGLRADGR